MESTAQTVLARLDPSPFRRVLGIAAQLVMAGFMVWIALTLPHEMMAQRLGMMLFGGLVLCGAYLTWRATARGLILTERGLVDGTGRLLAEVSNIRMVSRGALALRPSHGFSLLLYSGMGFGWVPGLWWRVGKRVGVGGLTSPQSAKLMAEVIAGMIVPRE